MDHQLDLRDRLAGVVRKHHRDLGDDYTRALPGYLDALVAVADQQFLNGPAFEQHLGDLMRRNPQLLETWIRQRQRVHGTHLSDLARPDRAEPPATAPAARSRPAPRTGTRKAATAAAARKPPGSAK